LRENPSGGASFARGRRWLVAYSPLRGCSQLAALATAKIRCRRPAFHFHTGSKTHHWRKRNGRFVGNQYELYASDIRNRSGPTIAGTRNEIWERPSQLVTWTEERERADKQQQQPIRSPEFGRFPLKIKTPRAFTLLLELEPGRGFFHQFYEQVCGPNWQSGRHFMHLLFDSRKRNCAATRG